MIGNITSPPSLPTATYRLQLNKNFTFYDVIDIADYLQALGISHLYLSPVFEAMPGSMHGYDIIDFNKISTERGGETGLRALDDKLSAMDPPLSLLLDIVPNHMAASTENSYWQDVLDNGHDSPFWSLFDIHTDSEGHMNGYRRFFSIDSLVGLRVEDEQVFAKTHEKLFALASTLNSFAGVRVDHIDGLADPATYLTRLQQHIPLIWVEKILAGPESLREDWPVQGTTGYEFAAAMNELFTHPAHFTTIEKYWQEKIQPRWPSFDACAQDSKAEILGTLFVKEHKHLSGLIDAPVFWSGFTPSFPVYRTYITDEKYAPQDRSYIEQASKRAGAEYGIPYIEEESAALPRLLGPINDSDRQARRSWQQLCSAVFAKGVEDTAQYRYTPLLALNEVGGNGALLGNHELPRWLDQRRGTGSAALNASSTHDTKRSEDVRARLNALADQPAQWLGFYEQACTVTRQFRRGANKAIPNEPCTWFLFQTMVGLWPLDGRIDDEWRRRLKDYMTKALREANLETGWIAPVEDYEAEIQGFIDAVLGCEDFLQLAYHYCAPLAATGALNALAILTLKTLAGGIPDFYQGTEHWNFTLVDPDNRRPVNFKNRKTRLQSLRALERELNHHDFLTALMEGWQDGLIKLWLTRTLLQIRRDYTPGGQQLTIQHHPVSGIKRHHILSFSVTCSHTGQQILVTVPRYPGALKNLKTPSLAGVDWHDTTIERPNLDSAKSFYCLLQKETLSQDAITKPAELFRYFPLSILRTNPY